MHKYVCTQLKNIIKIEGRGKIIYVSQLKQSELHCTMTCCALGILQENDNVYPCKMDHQLCTENKRPGSTSIICDIFIMWYLFVYLYILSRTINMALVPVLPFHNTYVDHFSCDKVMNRSRFTGSCYETF